MASRSAGKKLVVIVGPTASGKTELAVRLARNFRGEIVSADSRQVYRGLDRTAAKATGRQRRLARHHLLDVVRPRQQLSVVMFQKRAARVIADIQKRARTPFLVGGAGFYVDAVVYGTLFPEVKTNAALRRRLAKKSAAQLYVMLSERDPARAREIDPFNARRLIRALEIIKATGRTVPPRYALKSHYDVLWLGVRVPPDTLRRRIRARLQKRLRAGMVAEVQRLGAWGLPTSRLESLGFAWRIINRYLAGELTKAEMIERLERAEYRYAKRQMTWFKKNPEIRWVGNFRGASRLVRAFLKN